MELSQLGWDAAFAAGYATVARDGDRPGRVVRVDRGACTVLTGAGPVRAHVPPALLANPVAVPCAGDWVVVRGTGGRIWVAAVLPRRTSLVRRTAGRQSTGQVLAANLDAAAVIEPIDPSPDPNRVERMLALAWESGAQPLVVLTKADLAADPATIADEFAETAPGVAVLPVSAERGEGLDPLRPWVRPGRTLALLGPSGAGKSTLVNALAGATVMATQLVRRADGKGRHTTTYRALIPLPGGGAVLDTPGLRAVGLLDTADGLERTFADVAELVAGCRFADCRHETEPGCAVRAALVSGELGRRRWESWQQLQREVAYEARRRDTRLAAAERTRWTRIPREARARARP